MKRPLLSALVLAIAALIARLPQPRLTAGGAELSQAREVAAYVVGSDPVRIPIPAGQRLLRVLTNYDLPAGAPAAGTPYLLALRVPEDDRSETFPLLALPARDATGAPAAIYLGEALTPAQTREVGLLRDRAGAATLEVALVGPGGGARPRASLRVLLLHDRPPWALQDALARRTSPGGTTSTSTDPAGAALAWRFDLEDDQQRGLLAQRWVRAPAVNGTASRRLYFIATPAPPLRTSGPSGAPVAAGMALAYTVRGPGTLHLLADAPLDAQVRILDESGAERSLLLQLAADHRTSLPVAGGLSTVRVQTAAAGRVIALVATATMVVPPARLRNEPGHEGELSPGWTHQEAVRIAGPAPLHAPVVWNLTDRPPAPLRLSAWLPLGSSPRAAEVTLVILRYRLLDPAGRVIGSGALRGPVTAAPEDRLLDDPPRALSSPVTGVLWPGARAAQLVLDADRETLVTISSPGHDPAPTTRDRRDAAVQLLHAPAELPRWYRVDPEPPTGPGASAPVAELAFAQRLELRPPPAPPPPAETIAALGDPPRVSLLEPAPPGRQGAGGFWPIPAGHSLPVRAGARADTGAPTPAGSVFYAARGRADRVAGHNATITIDGRRGRGLRLFSGSGQLPLPPLAAGIHQLRIDAPAPVRLFVELPVEGAAELRKVSAYRLGAGRALHANVVAGSTASSFGVAAYGEGPLGPDARLEIRIDGGTPAVVPGVLTATHTDGTRVVDLVLTRASAALMWGRAGGEIWIAPPIIVPLATDLRRRRHRISVIARDTGRAVFLRLFRLGDGPRPERMVHFTPLRTAVNP